MKEYIKVPFWIKNINKIDSSRICELFKDIEEIVDGKINIEVLNKYYKREWD